jgi:carbamoyl-phosphate synthase large subunit
VAAYLEFVRRFYEQIVSPYDFVVPRRTDTKSILVIGSRPIVTGPGAAFAYSGTQARKALREEGCSFGRTDSNPLTDGV